MIQQLESMCLTMMRWALEILSPIRVDLAGSFINDSSINGGENAPVPLLGNVAEGGRLLSLSITGESESAGGVTQGGAESDLIIGARGNDVLSAGGGNDRIESGAGRDTLFGEDGDDQLSFMKKMRDRRR